MTTDRAKGRQVLRLLRSTVVGARMLRNAEFTQSLSADQVEWLLAEYDAVCLENAHIHEKVLDRAAEMVAEGMKVDRVKKGPEQQVIHMNGGTER